MTVLETVAFDIETTGFTVKDQLTVVGFDSDIGSRLFLNTGDRRPARDWGQHRFSFSNRLCDTEAFDLDRFEIFLTKYRRDRCV